MIIYNRLFNRCVPALFRFYNRHNDFISMYNI